MVVHPASHGISRVPRYSGSCSRSLSFAYQTFTVSGSLSMWVRLPIELLNAVRNPGEISLSGLASSPFARHYWGNLGWCLFLALLRCFSSGGSPHIPIWFSIWCMNMTPCGFLHSEICGSMLAYSSPQLIAVNHVLLRLPMPRHSPCALLRFTFRFRNVFRFCWFSFANYAKILFFRYLYRFLATCSYPTSISSHSWDFVDVVVLRNFLFLIVVSSFCITLAIQFSRYLTFSPNEFCENVKFALQTSSALYSEQISEENFFSSQIHLE